MDTRSKNWDEFDSLKSSIDDFEPMHFTSTEKGLVFFCNHSKKAFSCKNLEKLADIELAYHPVFFQGKPFHIDQKGNIHVHKKMVHAIGSKRPIAMTCDRIYDVSKGGSAIFRSSLILGIEIDEEKDILLIHESVEGYSCYERSSLKLLEMTDMSLKTVYDGEGCITHFCFDKDEVVFISDEMDFLKKENLDPFKIRPLGLNRLIKLDNQLFFVVTQNGIDKLAFLDNAIHFIDTPLTSIQEIFVHDGELFIVGKSLEIFFGIFRLDQVGQKFESILIKSNPLPSIQVKDLSLLGYPGWIFGDLNTASHLVIRLHGGPFSHVEKIMQEEALFYNQRSISTIYLNYHGSTGFGRNYRTSLLGQYGKKDVQDVVGLIKALTGRGIDSSKIILKGKSSAGFTALLASLKSNIKCLFIYCPVTYKDEIDEDLKYLFGINYDPVLYLERIRTPMIVFQGENDKVIDPKKTEKFLELIKKMGTYFEYYSLKNVGHSIRGRDEMFCFEKELVFLNHL